MTSAQRDVFAPDGVRALTFDVFGTVVDWRGSIVREGEALGRARGLDVDWGAFADRWRALYRPAMDRVERGEIPWTTIDVLHRAMLDELAPRSGLGALTAADLDDLNLVWHRLTPWPDAVAGLELLRSRYVVATLSNGNVSLLVDMARHAGLRWDCVLSAELAERYKPNPAAYLTAARLLGLAPSAVMMVASHRHDLDAARRVGFRTAFVARPAEYGPRPADRAVDGEYDVVATDFLDLARRLGVSGGVTA